MTRVAMGFQSERKADAQKAADSGASGKPKPVLMGVLWTLRPKLTLSGDDRHAVGNEQRRADLGQSAE